MEWTDLFSLGPLVTALCIFVGGAVTIHAALGGRLSRGWGLAWLAIFAVLGAAAVWNGAHEARERRIAAERESQREQLDDARWGQLLGLARPNIRDVGLTHDIRLLSRAEQSKLTVLLRAMAPYNAEIFHAANPTSAAVAKQFEDILRESNWTVTAQGTVEGAIGYSVLSRPYVPNPPPGVQILNTDRTAAAKADAIVGLFWEFHLPAGGGQESAAPADSIVLTIGDAPYDGHVARWHHPADDVTR